MTALPALRAPAGPFLADAGVAAALAAWALAETQLDGWNPLGALFSLAATLPLAARRRAPVAVLLVIAAALVGYAATGPALATATPFPSLLLATFTVAAQVRSTALAAVLGVVPVAAMLSASLFDYFDPDGLDPAGLVILCFFVAGAWAGGRVVRHRALAAESGAEAVAAEAVAAERARIARELHDVVAHAVSVVVVQTAAAEQFLDRDTERARTHLGLARRTATEAMTEMRHLLGVLREDEPVYDPQPGIDRLAELAGGSLEIEGDARSVPDGVSLAVYRIVQEALTNARRHAPGADTRVRVAIDPGRVRVEVGNGAPAREPEPPAEGGGRGLPGMRERVRVYGGSLVAGPEGAGWAVRAELPTAGARG